MKDLLTNLPLVSLPSGVPAAEIIAKQSRGALLRILFAAACTKISQQKQAKNSSVLKQRLILIVPDEVLLFHAADGVFKRRVKLLTIASLYFSIWQHEHQSQFVAEVGIVVPSQYDMALRFVGRSDSDVRGMVFQLVRVIGLRQRQQSDEDTFRELQVVQFERENNGTSSSSCFGHMLKLKKAGTNFLAMMQTPFLPVVTAEWKKKMSDDPTQLLEEAREELQMEFQKLKQEAWDKKNEVTRRMCEKIATALNEERCLKDKVHLTNSRVVHLRAENAEKQQVNAALLKTQRQAVVDESTMISHLRNKHEEDTNGCRLLVQESELHIGELVLRVGEEGNRFIEEMATAEAEVRQEQQQLTTKEIHREGVEEALPTMDQLIQETSELRAGFVDVERQIVVEEEEVHHRVEHRELIQSLRVENAELETEVLALMHCKRDVKTSATELSKQSAMLSAKCDQMERHTLQVHASTQRLNVQRNKMRIEIERKQSVANLQPKTQAVADRHRMICEDLERETLFHDSCTSTALAATLQTNATIDELREKIKKLRSKRT